MKLRFFKILPILAILIFTLSIINAQEEQGFDAATSFLWLANHCKAGNCANSVMASSFYALAFKNSGYPEYGQQAIDYIKTQKHNSQHCFPSNKCTVKDTAFAMLAYEAYGLETNDIENYIQESLKAGLTENWWLEVVTDASNTSCKIQYPKDGELEEIEIKVDKGEFPDCHAGQPKTYFDLNDCIIPNLVNSNPAIELMIDCSKIGPSTLIAIIYNTGNSYYLTDQATTSKYSTKLQNACHPETKNSACNKETSLWANYILHKQKSDISTSLWLMEKYDNLQPVDNSLLYLTTSEQKKQEKFIKDLQDIQKLDGSFDKSAFKTAVAALALEASGSTEELNEAIEWLQKNRKQDGSWDESVLTTSVVLYSVFSNAAISLPTVGFAGGEDYCGDGVCHASETSYSCPKDCKSATTSGCIENGLCEVDFGEDSVTCQADCYCGDGVCDSEEMKSGMCSSDCGTIQQEEPAIYCGNDIAEGTEECDGYDDIACPELCTSFCTCQKEKKGGFGWIILIIVIILLLVAAFLAYNKYLKHPKTKRSFSRSSSFKMPPRQPPSKSQYKTPSRLAQRGPAKTRAETQLERSLKEAEKILKK